MTTAPNLLLGIPASCVSIRAGRTIGRKLVRILFFLPLFSIIFVPEFSRDDALSAGSIIYSKAVAGFRYIDLAIIAIVFIHLVLLCCSRRKLWFPQNVLLPGVAFLVCISIAIGYGSSRGGTNFFFDWRGLALGIGMYVVWAFWVQSYYDVKFAIKVFAIFLAARISLLYILYLAGYGDTLLGASIPVFDGPIISCIAFTALFALSYQDTVNQKHRLAVLFLAAAACLLVVLCMRRTYWGELGIGLTILLVLRKRNRVGSLIVMAAVLALAATLLGSSFSYRLQSLNVTRADTRFSTDNADHVNDLVDAWDQVRQSPIMGIGLGTAYPTWHIRNWKPESVMVHNAPLHVWLKYGLAGLLCYLWFHLALLYWLYRQVGASSGSNRAFSSAAFAYLAAQFIVTLGFAPWPYSELQLTVLMSFLLAGTVAASRSQPCSCRI